jgi:hypothetical protein
MYIKQTELKSYLNVKSYQKVKKKLPEELECRVSSDLVGFGKLALLGGVDLSKLDGGLLFSKDAGSLGVFGGQGLAVAAPRGVELHQDELVISDGLLEVLLCENKDAFLLLDFIVGKGRSHEGQAG